MRTLVEIVLGLVACLIWMFMWTVVLAILMHAQDIASTPANLWSLFLAWLAPLVLFWWGWGKIRRRERAARNVTAARAAGGP